MKILKFLVLGATAFLLSNSAVFAESINNFKVDIKVNDDASINVTEKILYDFGPWDHHGIYRAIPLLYGPQDEEVAIDMEVFSVTDENGNAYQYQVSEDYYNLNVRIGDPDVTVTGEHWYEISYKADLIVNGFEDHDELYWNVTGTDWGDVDINNVEVRVELPEGVSSEPMLACYTGIFGSTEQNCSYQVEDFSQVSFRGPDFPLYNGQGMTIVVGMEKGLVHGFPAFLSVNSEPYNALVDIGDGSYGRFTPAVFRVLPGTYTLKLSEFGYKDVEDEIVLKEGERVEKVYQLEETFYFIFFHRYFPWVFAIFGTLFIFWFWHRWGRDPEGRGTIMPFYKAPKIDGKPLSAGELGVLYDEIADYRDITAVLIELANKGYLKIECVFKNEKSKKAKDFKFVKLKEPDDQLVEFQTKLMEALFGEKKIGKSVKMSDLENKFYTSLYDLKKSLYRRVVEKGYFPRSPDSVRTGYFIASIVSGFVLFWISGLFMFLWNQPMYLVTMPFVGVVGFLFSFFMPRKTVAGVLALEKVVGFRMFLDTAEKDRIKELFEPKDYKGIFVDYLPYAVAFGIEKKWVKAFDGLFKGVPSWFKGRNDYSDFVRNFDRFSSKASTTYASKPVSSGSSSWGSGSSSGSWGGSSGFSSGGGFSGGGFGGGGGGSW